MLKNNGVQSVLFALLLLMASTYSAALEKVAERGDIAKYRLANGLKIILAPDASGDAVFFNLIYQVGSLDDPEGKSGTAHLLEHLMFRGTEQRSGKALTQELSQRGIQFNATTSYDRTRYSAMLDSDSEKLDFLLALEAERVLGRHPTQSRLSKRFRQDKGLTYGIRTSIKIANLGTDSWINIESSYPMTQGEKFADLVRDEVSKLIEVGITEEELLQAKQTIFQERQLALGQDQIILAQLPNQTYRGHTYHDWIKRNNDFATVTLDQVNAAIRKHLASAIWIELLADRAGSKD